MLYYYNSTIVAFLNRIFYANCPKGEIWQTLKMLYSRAFRPKYYTKQDSQNLEWQRI